MRVFRFLTIAVFAAATLPRLAQRGMFVDGVTYASIARNLAEGRGTFWTPFYTDTLYPQFHQHPALGLWLQSLWFRALGDHLIVERAYSLTAAAITALLVAAIWRATASESGGRQHDWLPVAFWILVPVVSWSIVGNMLETTVSLFTTAAVFAAIASGRSETLVASLTWSAVSGLCVVAAVGAKGPVGLFPLSAPILLASTRSRHRIWTVLVPQWATTVLAAALVWSFDESRASVLAYLSAQLLPAVGSRRELTPDSFLIAKMLLQGVWLPMSILAAILFAAARGVAPVPRTLQARALSFLMLGLAGTLPILISTKQMGHYLVPAVPLHALAASCLVYPTVAPFAERFSRTHRYSPNIVGLAIVAGTIGASFVPALERDGKRLANLSTLASSIPRSAVVGICESSSDDWGLHAWFERLFLVSLDPAEGRQRQWFLKSAPPLNDCPPARCAEITDSSQELVLMKCPQP
jgi:4-amino-4-deoxy-L-arabinose transferase-like glycosyltransferase